MQDSFPILLIANGTLDASILSLDFDHYAQIICTDGAALHFFNQTGRWPDRVLGDGDSLISSSLPTSVKWIALPDQNHTDLEKTLAFLLNEQVDISSQQNRQSDKNRQTDKRRIDLYGATGGDLDHLLGNLAAMQTVAKQCDLHLFDASSEAFFATETFELDLPSKTTLSFIPLPLVTHFTVRGVDYPLTDATLCWPSTLSLRNRTHQKVSGQFDDGDLLIVIKRAIV